jgi:hypothetical protein
MAHRGHRMGTKVPESGTDPGELDRKHRLRCSSIPPRTPVRPTLHAIHKLAIVVAKNFI